MPFLDVQQIVDRFAEFGATVTPDILELWDKIGVPTSPSFNLTRASLAETLSRAGYPTTRPVLDNAATAGTGPKFRRYGNYALTEWGCGLAWAQARCGAEVSSTSEDRSAVAIAARRAQLKVARDTRDKMRADGVPMGRAKSAVVGKVKSRRQRPPDDPPYVPSAKANCRRRKAHLEAAPSAPA
jgi:hypothetical protein